MWDPHQILTKTSIQKKLEIDAFFSAIVIVFQSAYRAEIHQNDVFLFFLNYFLNQHIKLISKHQTAGLYNVKKIIIKFRPKADGIAIKLTQS